VGGLSEQGKKSNESEKNFLNGARKRDEWEHLAIRYQHWEGGRDYNRKDQEKGDFCPVNRHRREVFSGDKIGNGKEGLLENVEADILK